LRTLEDLRAALIELDEERTLAITREILAKGGVSPHSILGTCQDALRVVGERYEREEYFISGLIMAGELFKEVLELVQPLYEQEARSASTGTIVLGTVAKDIHDIGKNLFGTSLRSYGFDVIDLGVDVTPERFFEEVKRSKADVVCLSGLIAAAFESMKQTVDLLRRRQDELGYRPPVVLGGAIIDGRVCEYAGADSWSTDAIEGVRICQNLVARPAD
jgi:methylmalonyl-CoA mutase cobalamin-binding domain/chain